MRSKLQRVLENPGVIVLVAFALRAAILFHEYWKTPLPIPREEYFGFELGRVARSIASGHGFSSPLNAETGPTAWFTPVYPYLLAGIFKILGVFSLSSNVAVRLLNCAFSSLMCFPL